MNALQYTCSDLKHQCPFNLKYHMVVGSLDRRKSSLAVLQYFALTFNKTLKSNEEACSSINQATWECIIKFLLIKLTL